MKKLLRLFFAVAMILALCAACDPEQYEGVYYVRNHTDQTLHLLQSGSGHSIHTPTGIIAPGDSIGFGSAWIQKRKKRQPYFEMWIQDEVARQGQEVSLKVSSGDKVLLKEWRYLDRDRPGKQFFKESFWRHYDVFIKAGAFTTTTDIWVFDIEPEDLTQPEP